MVLEFLFYYFKYNIKIVTPYRLFGPTPSVVVVICSTPTPIENSIRQHYIHVCIDDFIYLLLETEEGRRRWRETSMACLSYMPWPVTEPASQAWCSDHHQWGPLALPGRTQPAEPHQSGPVLHYLLFAIIYVF